MKRFSTSALTLVLASGLLLGCEEQPKPSGEATSATQAAQTAPAPNASTRRQRTPRRPRGRRGGSGPVGMLLAAADDLKLEGEQQAKLDAVEAKMRGDASGAMKEMRDYQNTVMEGVRAGKIETDKLAPMYESMDRSMKARMEKQVEALDGLYAALTPEQRKTVVAAVRKRMADRAERTPKDRPEKPEPKARAKNKLERMTKDLSLDDAQQKKLEPLLVKEVIPEKNKADARAESEKRTTALLDAFEKDGFDAKKLDLSMGPDPKKMRERMDARIALMNQITAILKPEQREKLATTMRRGRGGRLQNPMRRGGGNMRAMPMPGGFNGRRARAEVMSEDATWTGPSIELPYDDAPTTPPDTTPAPAK